MKDNKDCKAIFCENVRWLRKFHGFSKTEMAEKMEITVGELESVEAGGVIPENVNLKTLWNMQCAFKIEIYILFGYSLEKLYNKLTPDVIAALIELIAVCAPKNKAEK